MGIVYDKKSRRQFLVGSGQALLALPFLPSLFGSDAQAQTAYESNRRMMIFWFNHANPEEFWLKRSFATDPVGSSGAKEKMLSTLANATDISPMLSNAAYDKLRQQNLITIIRGLSVQKGFGHGSGVMGGHADTVAGNLIQSSNNWPTFDSMIESSLSVYPASTPANVTKAIRIDFNGWGAFLKKVGGNIQLSNVYGYDRSKNNTDSNFYTLPVLYTDVFKGLTNGTVSGADTTNLVKTNILNRVHQSYLSFKSSRKISSEDLARLDQHLGFIADLQRSLTTNLPQVLSCSTPTVPGVSNDPLVYTPLYFDLLAIAFKCGLTKFGAMSMDGGDYPNNWWPGLTLPQGLNLHGAVHGGDPATQAYKGQGYKAFYGYGLEQIASRFLAPLSELEGNTGRSYIDNMATVVLSTMSIESISDGSGHYSGDNQQMVLGSMGGRIRSGRYIQFPVDVNGSGNSMSHNAFSATMLELMGIPKSEYSVVSSNGRGYGYYNLVAGNPYGPRFYDPITEMLV